jgi:multiple sugar transport system substrate-binding protein
MSKGWRVFALLLVLAVVAAACSSDDDSSDTTAAADDAATEETTADDAAADEGEATGEEVTLVWRTRPDNDEEAGVYQTVSDSLDAQFENVTLTYEPGVSEGEDYQQAVLTQLAGGTAPDVFWIPGAEIANFAQRDVILDLREYADATGHNDGDFYPGPMEQLTTDAATGEPGNALWGLPRDVSAFALYLNMDLINEAGAPDPRELAANGEWDWDAFREVAAAVDALGPDISGYGQSSWWGPVGYWVNSGGGGFYNEDGTACGLDTPESLAGLEFISDFYADGLGLTFGEDPEPSFRAGNVGMFQNGRWATPGIRQVDFNWDVVKLPDGPGGPSNWLFWGAYVVNAATEHPEEAWQLVQALTAADVQAQVAELGANIPSRASQEALDAFLTFSPPDNNQAFLDGISENPATEAPLWNGDWPSFSADMTTAVGSVISGDTSVDDFAGSICSELNQYFN